MHWHSTDAKLDKLGLVVLADDRSYFPRYDAVLLYRADLPTRWPKTWDALKGLEGRIDDATMRRMNAAAELDKQTFAAVAQDFLAQRPGSTTRAARGAGAGFWSKLFGPDFARLTFEHLSLVFLSLVASIAIGIPLGIAA